MNKIFTNQEQLEAHQEQLNKANAKRFETLSLEDRNKIEALNKAVEILAKAQIPCYLFPYLKFWDKHPVACAQYNTGAQIKEFWNESGNLNKDTYKDFIFSTIAGMFKMATECTPEIAKLPPEQHFNAFIPYLAHILNAEFDRIRNYQEDV